MDSYPSALTTGDIIFCKKEGAPSFKGEVGEVFENGAFVMPIDEHGIRLLRRTEWCTDEDTFVEEINGESLF